MNPTLTGLSTLARLAPALSLSVLLAGCTFIFEGGESSDEGGPSSGEPTAGPTDGHATGGPTDGMGASGPYPTSGHGPCDDGSGGCWTSGYDPCSGGTGGGCWTSGYVTSGASDSDGNGGAEGSLITTGNEEAAEWDVTVRHTPSGQAPVEDTYLVTTLLQESDFYAVVAVPSGFMSTSYGYIDGDYLDGDITIIDGSISSFDVSIEGTLQLTELTLGGSGTFHDAETDALMGTWEILSATPLP